MSVTDAAGAAGKLEALIAHRFGDRCAVDPVTPGLEVLATMADHRVKRHYTEQPVPLELVRLLCAVALSSPTKSDLQQRDIVILQDAAQHERITRFFPGDPWMAKAPVFLVFCGNNRRQRQLHEWRGKPFANDHLDPFFNAAVDAAIALGAFVAAAEAVGLGCCPISVIRNYSDEVSEILGLPQHVFPVAGMTLGWPANHREISLRLPLAATVHVDRFDDADVRAQMQAYDRRRNGVQPYRQQRDVAQWGEATDYGWMEDKARQYAKPDRADFGQYVRSRGFKLA
jgi:nitroreductase/FMN reductase [NAD(P)H]